MPAPFQAAQNLFGLPQSYGQVSDFFPEEDPFINQLNETKPSPRIQGVDPRMMAQAAQMSMDPFNVMEMAKKIQADIQGQRLIRSIGDIDFNEKDANDKIARLFSKNPLGAQSPSVQHVFNLKQLASKQGKDTQYDDEVGRAIRDLSTIDYSDDEAVKRANDIIGGLSEGAVLKASPFIQRHQAGLESRSLKRDQLASSEEQKRLAREQKAELDKERTLERDRQLKLNLAKSRISPTDKRVLNEDGEFDFDKAFNAIVDDSINSPIPLTEHETKQLDEAELDFRKAMHNPTVDAIASAFEGEYGRMPYEESKGHYKASDMAEGKRILLRNARQYHDDVVASIHGKRLSRDSTPIQSTEQPAAQTPTSGAKQVPAVPVSLASIPPKEERSRAKDIEAKQANVSADEGITNAIEESLVSQYQQPDKKLEDLADTIDSLAADYDNALRSETGGALAKFEEKQKKFLVDHGFVGSPNEIRGLDKLILSRRTTSAGATSTGRNYTVGTPRKVD